MEKVREDMPWGTPRRYTFAVPLAERPAGLERYEMLYISGPYSGREVVATVRVSKGNLDYPYDYKELRGEGAGALLDAARPHLPEWFGGYRHLENHEVPSGPWGRGNL